MEKETETIKQGQSEINPIRSNQKAEFLSVVSSTISNFPTAATQSSRTFLLSGLMYKGENKKTDIQKTGSIVSNRNIKQSEIF